MYINVLSSCAGENENGKQMTETIKDLIVVKKIDLEKRLHVQCAVCSVHRLVV